MLIAPRFLLPLFVLVAVAGCSPSPGSEIETNCGAFCDGFVGCIRGIGCTPRTSDGDVRAFCMNECSDVAMRMTPAQLDETLVCLRCMDTQIDPGTCTASLLDAASNVACMTQCRAPGPSFYLSEFGTALSDPATTPYTCPAP